MSRLVSTTTETPFGSLRLVASNTGLRAVLWPNDPPDRVRLDAPVHGVGGDDHEVLAATIAQLAAYSKGILHTFDLPLDLRGTPFQVDAWLALAEIPYGETTTYRDQAARLGRPRASRAVGAANAANPISIILPCHRVLATTGALTGFAAGLPTKSALLTHERTHTPTR